jgi:hypothetical protein
MLISVRNLNFPSFPRVFPVGPTADVFSTKTVFKISPEIRHRTSLPANTDIIFVSLFLRGECFLN